MDLSDIVRVKEVRSGADGNTTGVNDLLEQGWILLNVAWANPADGEGGTYKVVMYSLGLPREVAERPENIDKNWDIIKV